MKRLGGGIIAIIFTESFMALIIHGPCRILGRTAGKIGGAWLDATMGSVEEKIKKYLGLGLLSQAGVAIGLSLLIKNDFFQLAIQYDLPHAATIGQRC